MPRTPAPIPPVLHRSERKVVTVLFADIKGSLALVAGQDPEMAGEIMARVVACMGEAIRRHGGMVNQIMGDGVMALFGAPIAMEDHAAKACLAAMAMRLAINGQVRPRVAVRVGMGTGEVVVRAVPGDVGLHYSAAGEAVHMAARMEQAAAPDQILLTDGTRQFAGALVEVRALDSSIKGVEGPIRVFELLGVRLTRPPGTNAAVSPIVGRDRELDLLRRARDRAAAGEGQAIRLVGDAGSGKSRLVREFTGQHLSSAWRLCSAEALSHRRTSYGVVSELLAGLFHLQPEDGPADRRQKVEAALDLASSERERAVAPLSALLGLQAETREWTALDAWERRERTIASTVQAFQRLSRTQPLALVVEDAHWLDAESATSIQRVGSTAAGRQLLSVITQRAGHGMVGAEWDDARWIACTIGPLDEAATLAFLRARLQPGPDVAALERKLIEHTQGNPLFLEECLQALLENGDLVHSGGMVRLQHPIPRLEVPKSLRGLLDARVDRLDEAEKDVLQAAAVVGSTVPLDLLSGAAGLAEPALRAVLARLVRAGFLVEEARHYAFRHGLIREAAYSGMLKRSRVRMHGAVLEALERRPGSAETIVDLLANHAVLAETWPKAVVYAKQAAVRALGRYANPEAVDYYRQSLLAAAQLPMEGQDSVLLDLHLGVRTPLFRMGNVIALGPHLDEAVRLAAAQQTATPEGREALAQAYLMRSHGHWLRGEPQAALADAAAAAAMAAEHGDLDLAVRAQYQCGLVALSQSDVPGTLAAMGSVVEYMGPAPQTGRYGLDVDLVITALGYMARAHVASGDLVAARADCDRALALAAPIERRQTKIWAHMADGVVALAEGRLPAAVEALTQADEFCRGADMRLLSPVAAQFLAQAHLAAGNVVAAASIARQAVDDAARMGFQSFHPHRLAILAQALLATGARDEAVENAEAALTSARRIGEAGAEVSALMLLGDASNTDTARYDQARAIALRLGLIPMVHALDQRLAARHGG